MNSQHETHLLKFTARINSLMGVATIACTFSVASARDFIVPEDTALRVRLDDTLTSADSQVGDPFSATVVDQGDYRNARV